MSLYTMQQLHDSVVRRSHISQQYAPVYFPMKNHGLFKYHKKMIYQDELSFTVTLDMSLETENKKASCLQKTYGPQIQRKTQKFIVNLII